MGRGLPGAQPSRRQNARPQWKQRRGPGPSPSPIRPAATPLSVVWANPSGAFCRRHLHSCRRFLESMNPSHGLVPRRRDVSAATSLSADPPPLISLPASPPAFRSSRIHRAEPHSSLPAVKNRFGEFFVALQCRRAAPRRLSWAGAQDRDAGRCGSNAWPAGRHGQDVRKLQNSC